MAHRYTAETILNFTCEHCSNWWSYATQGSTPYVPEKFTCPHCGVTDKTEAPPLPGPPGMVKLLEDFKTEQRKGKQRVACGD